MENTQKPNSRAGLREALLLLSMCLCAVLCAVLSAYAGVIPALPVLLVTSALFALLILISRGPAPMALGILFSVTLFQITGGFALSLMGVVTLLAGFLLSQLVKAREAKTTVMIWLSLVLGAGFLAVFACLYALDGGSLALSDLFEKYHTVFKELRIDLAEGVREFVDQIDEERLTLYAQMGVTKEMLIESYMTVLDSALDLMELVIPGFYAVAIQLIAYAMICAFRIVAGIVGVGALLPVPVWHLVPTTISCVIYMLASAFYIFGSFIFSADSVVMAVLMNLWLVLLPVMMLCGVRVLILQLREPGLRGRTIIIMALMVLGCFFVPAVALRLALFVLSLMGARGIYMIRMASAQSKKIS